MNKLILDQITQLYNFKVKAILGNQKGYRNTSYFFQTNLDKTYNICFYKKEPDILQKIINANHVSDYLYKSKFPTRKTILNKFDKSIIILTPKSPNNTQKQYACIYSFLPGKTIAWEAYTKNHLKLIGKVMSNMHFCLKNFPEKKLKSIPLIYDELFQLNNKMYFYFSSKLTQKAIYQKLHINISLDIFDKFNQIIKKISQKKDLNILHMDFVRSNILFSNKNHYKYNSQNLSFENKYVSGILDFEKLAKGLEIIDIARTLAFLLVDCKYKDPTNIRKYFLLSGYKKRGKNKLKNINYLNDLIKFFLIYDFYKFLKHNPYEYLNQNEHFIRTKYFLSISR